MYSSSFFEGYYSSKRFCFSKGFYSFVRPFTLVAYRHKHHAHQYEAAAHVRPLESSSTLSLGGGKGVGLHIADSAVDAPALLNLGVVLERLALLLSNGSSSAVSRTAPGRGREDAVDEVVRSSAGVSFF